MPTLSLKSLICTISEGDIFDDKPVLEVYVDNEATPRQTIKIGEIEEGKPHALNNQYNFTDNVLVRLYDTDTVSFDEDDHIGDVTIKSNEPNTTAAYKAFTKDDASYNLVYALSGARDPKAGPQCYELKVKQIQCLTTEDDYSDDHLLLTVNVDVAAAQYSIAPKGLDNKEKWSLNPVFVTYCQKTAEVVLQNLDGVVKIGQAIPINQNSADQLLHLTKGSTAYDLTYQLTPIKVNPPVLPPVSRRISLKEIEIVKAGGRDVTWALQINIVYGDSTTPDTLNKCTWTLKNVKDGSKVSAVPDNQCTTKFMLEPSNPAKTLRVAVMGTVTTPVQSKTTNLPITVKEIFPGDLQKDNTGVITPPTNSAQLNFILHYKLEGAG